MQHGLSSADAAQPRLASSTTVNPAELLSGFHGLFPRDRLAESGSISVEI